MAFVLNAKLKLQAPTSSELALVQKQIGAGLKGVSAPVDVRVSPQAIKQTQRLTQSITQVSKASKQGAESVEDFGRRVGIAGKRFLAFSLATLGAVKAIGALRAGLSDAIAFEREIVKIGQVSGRTLSQLSDLRKEILKTTSSIGVDSQEIAEAAITLAQTGKPLKQVRKDLDAIAKARLAPTFGSAKETVEGLIAVQNQFRSSTLSATQVLDKFNTVASKYPIEAQDLVVAVKKAGGAFSAAGGDLDELLGLFSAVRSTTRESADTIGTAFRTITGRLSRIKSIDFLEDKLGISLRDGQKIKAPLDAIKQITRALAGPDGQIDSRTTIFSQVVEELGGIRQRAKVIPILTEIARAEKIIATSRASGGSIAKDAAVAQETLSVQIVKVKEQFRAFIDEVIQDPAFLDFTRTLLDITKGLISVANAAKRLIPLAGILGGALALRGIGKLGSGIASTIPAFSKVPGFNAGGVPGGLIPGPRSIRDNRFGIGPDGPITVASGETIVTPFQRRKMGVIAGMSGHELFSQAGVPGYAGGGVLGGVSASRAITGGVGTAAAGLFFLGGSENEDLQELGATIGAVAVQAGILGATLISSKGILGKRAEAEEALAKRSQATAAAQASLEKSGKEQLKLDPQIEKQKELNSVIGQASAESEKYKKSIQDSDAEISKLSSSLDKIKDFDKERNTVSKRIQTNEALFEQTSGKEKGKLAIKIAADEKKLEALNKSSLAREADKERIAQTEALSRQKAINSEAKKELKERQSISRTAKKNLTNVNQTVAAHRQNLAILKQEANEQRKIATQEGRKSVGIKRALKSSLNKGAVGIGVGIAAQTAGSFLSDRANKNIAEGGTGTGLAGVGGALSGAATGASVGALFGPLGIAIGGLGGALAGLTSAVGEAEKAIIDKRKNDLKAIQEASKLGKLDAKGRLDLNNFIKGSGVESVNILDPKNEKEDVGILGPVADALAKQIEKLSNTQSDMRKAIEKSSKDPRFSPLFRQPGPQQQVDDTAKSNQLKEAEKQLKEIKEGKFKEIFDTLSGEAKNFEDYSVFRERFSNTFKEIEKVLGDDFSAKDTDAKLLAFFNEISRFKEGVKKVQLAVFDNFTEINKLFGQIDESSQRLSDTRSNISFLSGGKLGQRSFKDSFKNVGSLTDQGRRDLTARVGAVGDQFGPGGKALAAQFNEFSNTIPAIKEFIVGLHNAREVTDAEFKDRQNAVRERLSDKNRKIFDKAVFSTFGEVGTAGLQTRNRDIGSDTQKVLAEFERVIGSSTARLNSIFEQEVSSLRENLGKFRQLNQQTLVAQQKEISVRETTSNIIARLTGKPGASFEAERSALLTSGQTPQQIGQSIRDSQARAVELNKEAQSLTGDPRLAKEEQVSKEIENINKLNKALEFLTDATSRSADAQKRFAEFEKDRLSAKQTLEGLVTGDPKSQRSLARNVLTADAFATGQLQVDEVSARRLTEVVSYLKSVGEARVPGSELTGNELADRLLGQRVKNILIGAGDNPAAVNKAVDARFGRGDAQNAELTEVQRVGSIAEQAAVELTRINKENAASLITNIRDGFSGLFNDLKADVVNINNPKVNVLQGPKNQAGDPVKPQELNDGGMAGGRRFTSSHVDTIPAMLAKGEAVLTGEHQNLIESVTGMSAERLFSEIGVPGFASGGKVGGFNLEELIKNVKKKVALPIQQNKVKKTANATPGGAAIVELFDIIDDMGKALASQEFKPISSSGRVEAAQKRFGRNKAALAGRRQSTGSDKDIDAIVEKALAERKLDSLAGGLRKQLPTAPSGLGNVVSQKSGPKLFASDVPDSKKTGVGFPQANKEFISKVSSLETTIQELEITFAKNDGIFKKSNFASNVKSVVSDLASEIDIFVQQSKVDKLASSTKGGGLFVELTKIRDDLGKTAAGQQFKNISPSGRVAAAERLRDKNVAAQQGRSNVSRESVESILARAAEKVRTQGRVVAGPKQRRGVVDELAPGLRKQLPLAPTSAREDAAARALREPRRPIPVTLKEGTVASNIGEKRSSVRENPSHIAKFAEAREARLAEIQARKAKAGSFSQNRQNRINEAGLDRASAENNRKRNIAKIRSGEASRGDVKDFTKPFKKLEEIVNSAVPATETGSEKQNKGTETEAVNKLAEAMSVFPTELTIKGTVDLNVNLNGGGILERLEENLKKMVEEKIISSIQNYDRRLKG